jgi:quercetin dioxygenase-like cupin family protein
MPRWSDVEASRKVATSHLSYGVAHFVPGDGAVDRQRLIDSLRTEGLDVTEWTDDPGATYPEHSHEHREVRVVLTGAMTISAGGRSFVLGPGDRIDLDAHEAHVAAVGPAGVAYLAGRLVGNVKAGRLTSP